jgi:hypothetical protein
MVAAACAGSHRPSVLPPKLDPCVLVAPPHSPPESITVALSPAVDGAGQHQRRMTAEWFVVAQSYETLLGVDCRGRPYPKLARAWSAERVEGGQRWTITLDTSARFWNGDRVTANDVLVAWRSTSNTPSGELARLLAAATTVIDDHSFHVTLADSTPLTLADPRLAIHRARSESQWREGTGPYRVESRDTGGIALVAKPSGAASRVRVLSTSATAARDALDGGVDLLVTDDPAIVSYAAHTDELLTVPLPWDRTYVVLAPESAASDVSATDRLTLTDLVVEAVHSDARIAERPFWWESSNPCAAPVGSMPFASGPRSNRVVYHSGDRVAQTLAERLVALGGSRSARGADSVLGTLLPGLLRAGERAIAVALSASAFAAALHAGNDVAYVLPLPRFAPAPCYELAMLRRAAPWLESAHRALSLIDTRSLALVRRGRVGLSVDADGSLRLLDGASGKNAKP